MAEILVIDDDFEDLENLKNMLMKSDHKVTVATNGAQGLDLVNKKTFDLIMIDIQMPTLTGYDLIRILKEKIHNHTKLAFISIVPKKEVDLSDVDGFIQKPFSEKELLNKIKIILV